MAVVDNSHDDLWLETKRSQGLLQRTPQGDVFFPLVLFEWASRNKLGDLMSYHLKMCLDSDDQIKTGQEKSVEVLLMHYEIVRKSAYHHLKKNPSVGEFFSHSTVTAATSAADRKCEPELYSNDGLEIDFQSCHNLVKNTSNFKQLTESDWPSFDNGCTLYSQLTNEPGIEYITPHWRLVNGKSVLTAEVSQVKYIKSPKWKDWQDKLKRSPGVAALNKKGIPWFAVYYVSVDSGPLTYETDTVHFSKDALFKFTAPLGTLRLHLEKGAPNPPLSGAMLRHRPWVTPARLPYRIPRILLRML